MTRRLVLSYLAITVFVLLVLEIPLGITFASREENRLYADIERDARVLATEFEDYLERGEGPLAIDDAESYATRTGGRVVVLDRDGISLVDTSPDLDRGRDFSTRPEVARALAGGLATGARSSETLGQNLMFVAVPVGSAGQVYGAVRISYPRSTLDDRVADNWARLALLSAVVIAAVLAVGWVLARSVTRPVRVLQDASARVAEGDLSTRVDAGGPPELRSLAVAFNDMTARIEHTVQREKAFSADASHQLRTPLTALRLRLEALDYAVDPSGRGDLDAAVRETDRLAGIVDALLALARSVDGDAPLVDLDVVAAARDRLDMWSALADERAVVLDLDAPRAAHALAMRGALEQILDNLLSNALEVAPDGSRVRVAVAALPDVVTLAVVDEGPGMADADLERAFDRFWTTGGTGLGLAIVRQLAEASRGSVHARRAPGDGLEVQVTLRRSR